MVGGSITSRKARHRTHRRETRGRVGQRKTFPFISRKGWSMIRRSLPKINGGAVTSQKFKGRKRQTLKKGNNDATKRRWGFCVVCARSQRNHEEHFNIQKNQEKKGQTKKKRGGAKEMEKWE